MFRSGDVTHSARGVPPLLCVTVAVDDSTLADVEIGPAAGSTLSDAELIAATRAGDADAFAVLYERHVDAARACARRLTRSRAEADDLVAEGFARVLSALRRGKGPDLAFRPYLLTAVRNVRYDRSRRDSRVEFTDEPPESVNATLLAADYEREDRAMVAQAYASLPERWQMVLWHTDVEGRPPAEIAPLLGISANSVAALAYRAREGLRQAYLAVHVNRGGADACRGTVDKLSAFVRDGLSARDRRGVEEHLAGCTSCTALLAELEEANKSLKIVLIPVLAGIPAAAYLSGLSAGGITGLVRRHPAQTAAAAVAAAAALVFVAVALRAPGNDDAADALTVPPIGSGRPTTTTTTTTPAPTEPVTVVSPTAVVTEPFTVAPFDTGVPPITVVPFDTNATTVTTVRRTTTTVRRTNTTTTTRAPSTTTTTTTTPQVPGQPATTTTTTTTTTIPGTQAPVDPPAVSSSVQGIGPVYSGQAAYFRIRVDNAASGNAGSARRVAVGPADGVVVEFNVPSGTSFLGPVTGGWQCDQTGSTVRCLLPRIDAGVTKEAIFSLDVSAAAGSNVTVSPVVLVNGQRITANAVSRTVADGAAIADFTVLPGAALAVAGNSVMSCPGVNLATDPNCDTATSPRVPLPSSSATLTTSGTLQRGYLVWQGQGTPAPVTLTAPDGATLSVAPALTRTVANYPSAGLTTFVASADVTSFVAAHGNGSYTVSGISVASDPNSFGGWELLAVSDNGDGRMRALTLVLPTVGINQAVPSANVLTVDGLPTLGSDRGVAATILVGEGDRHPPLASGEAISINQMEIGGVQHPPATGNAYSSTIIGLGDANAYGTDLDLYGTIVAGSATTLSLDATTGSDGVVFSAVGLLYDL